MIPQHSQLNVIIVHYGDADMTRESIERVWASSVTPQRVVIVDHAITPLILLPHSGQYLIRPRTNAGYAGGLNIGLGVLFTHKVAERDIIICMNNDTLVAPTTFQKLLAYFSAAPTPTLVGVRWGVINPLTGRTSLASPGEQVQAAASLSYIDGAFFAMPWALCLRLKKIPDHYFLYWEDCLLSHQVRKLGYGRQVLPDLGITHRDRASHEQSAQQHYYLVRNGAHYLQTYTPRLVRVWWYMYNRGRYIYHTVRGRSGALIARAVWQGMRGRLGHEEHLV